MVSAWPRNRERWAPQGLGEDLGKGQSFGQGKLPHPRLPPGEGGILLVHPPTHSPLCAGRGLPSACSPHNGKHLGLLPKESQCSGSGLWLWAPAENGPFDTGHPPVGRQRGGPRASPDAPNRII